MTYNYLSIETPEVNSSSPSEVHGNLDGSISQLQTLPEFVKAFANEDEALSLTRDSLRNMLNPLEKSELLELLTMSVLQSPAVRSSVGYALSNMTTFRRLLVRNISFNSTTEDVKELLQSRYGLIEEGSVVYDRATGKSKGFAFMTFATVEAACNAIMDSNNGLIELQGRPVLLKFAADRVDAINTNSKVSEIPSDTSSVCPPVPVLSGRRLFVSALAPETTNETMALALMAFGDMEECFVVSTPNGVSRRFGFVTFVSDSSAWACLQQPVSIDGTIVSVQPATERSASSTLTGASKQGFVRSVSPVSPPPKQAAGVINELELVNNLLSGLNPDAISALFNS
jgi:heterogeneous nuclear ribonucleoprotein A1/A3